jgi:hypothetical protein
MTPFTSLMCAGRETGLSADLVDWNVPPRREPPPHLVGPDEVAELAEIVMGRKGEHAHAHTRERERRSVALAVVAAALCLLLAYLDYATYQASAASAAQAKACGGAAPAPACVDAAAQ